MPVFNYGEVEGWKPFTACATVSPGVYVNVSSPLHAQKMSAGDHMSKVIIEQTNIKYTLYTYYIVHMVTAIVYMT